MIRRSSGLTPVCAVCGRHYRGDDGDRVCESCEDRRDELELREEWAAARRARERAAVSGRRESGRWAA